MRISRTFLPLLCLAGFRVCAIAEPAENFTRVGLPQTPFPLKIFVEPGGSFSPGLGTFGVRLRTSEAVILGRGDVPMPEPRHGLAGAGLQVWWSEEGRGATLLRTEVCEVKRATPRGDCFIVAARARLTNTSDKDISTTLTVSISPEGPAGGPIHSLAFAQHAFSIEGHPVLIAQSPSRGATLASGALEARPFVPQQDAAVQSAEGTCRGEMFFDVTVQAKGSVTLGFLCPVLPGRRASEGGALQPDAGLDFYRGLNVDDIFAEAEASGRAK